MVVPRKPNCGFPSISDHSWDVAASNQRLPLDEVDNSDLTSAVQVLKGVLQQRTDL